MFEQTKVLLLKHFEDVLVRSFSGKRYTYRRDMTAPVPVESLNLWRQRGFEPSPVGVAVVRFEGNEKDWVYPLLFWEE